MVVVVVMTVNIVMQSLYWNPEDPAVANIDKIKKQIDKIAAGKCGTIKAIRLGGMTDCFQPIETKHKVTYETLKYLKEKKVPYLIVTKSDLIATDEYMAVLSYTDYCYYYR